MTVELNYQEVSDLRTAITARIRSIEILLKNMDGWLEEIYKEELARLQSMLTKL
jgi:hypothetical protein